jgi:hypothetical protein
VPSAQRYAHICILIDNEESNIASWAVGDLYVEQRFESEAQTMFCEVRNRTIAATHQLNDKSRLSEVGKQRLHGRLDAVSRRAFGSSL